MLLYPHTYSSLVQLILAMELTNQLIFLQTQCLLNVVFVHKGLQFSSKKQWNSCFCNKKDAPGEYYD